MNRRDRIVVNPDVCSGVPSVRGLNLPVRVLVQLVLSGSAHDEILHDYPDLHLEDIDAALEFFNEHRGLFPGL